MNLNIFILHFYYSMNQLLKNVVRLWQLQEKDSKNWTSQDECKYHLHSIVNSQTVHDCRFHKAKTLYIYITPHHPLAPTPEPLFPLYITAHQPLAPTPEPLVLLPILRCIRSRERKDPGHEVAPASPCVSSCFFSPFPAQLHQHFASVLSHIIMANRNGTCNHTCINSVTLQCHWSHKKVSSSNYVLITKIFCTL